MRSNIELREACRKAGLKGYYNMSNREMEEKLKNVEEDLKRKQVEQAKEAKRRRTENILKRYGFLKKQ